ncbi:2-polyprenyl-6-methoxyphenol hydroxylase [Brevibacterium sandarakinum]|uniref:2-polyprenyl-6-methoxyphenol hydroxylase n=1 Tax=Brevibacterium sandarakinum TaxID=629680 RepID=A0A1H1NEZ8_BRESA|nr:FAD-binding domain [Brevibacterium sandarakinum]SDR97551.1 2-polyprenyl-6-methoxyphenol hydroxylase [Brevibacterium sandarakinum]
MRVLIVGAGIAGSTLAYWLQKAGHEPTLVEHAHGLRRGGYLIDFWGTGFDVAEMMGLVPRLLSEGYQLAEARDVAADGHRVASLDTQRFVAGASERYVSILRSDLAAAIYDCLDDRVETIFGDTIARFTEDERSVRVEFEHAAPREFDLVVGADGLHSRVRELVFGEESGFERDLGIAVAAFDVAGYRPRDELVAVMHAEVGFQAIRVALRDDLTMFMLTFRHDGRLPADDVEAQRELVRSSLAGAGWEIPAILDRLPQARTLYLDRANQIRMPSWTSGRVALIGDAAASPSLLAGQGSALAMVEAYVLAAELTATPDDHRRAFDAYERRLMPMVGSKQDAAKGLGTAFAPPNRLQLVLRNTLMRSMGFPPVANLTMGRSLRDPIELPDWPGA